MIVSEVMTTRLATVTADDTLSHAANLLRQHQFHHLPVIRSGQGYYGMIDTTRGQRPVFEGLLTSEDIDVAAAVGTSSSEILHRPWQERRVVEVMHLANIRVTPTTSVAAAAQILVERGLNCLPVVEYETPVHGEEIAATNALVQAEAVSPEAQALLVNLAKDLAARITGGQQLLTNKNVHMNATARHELVTGQVDPRLLITLSALAHQMPLHLVQFDDSSPGASSAVPLRGAEIGAAAAASLSAMLAFLTHQTIYAPAQAAIVRGASGQSVVTVRYDAPGPLDMGGS